jgi:hypothetical protein
MRKSLIPGLLILAGCTKPDEKITEIPNGAYKISVRASGIL